MFLFITLFLLSVGSFDFACSSKNIPSQKGVKNAPKDTNLENIELVETTDPFLVSETDTPSNERGLKAKHYPSTNEYRLDLFFPHVKNLGGCYLGVGTDQNLTLASWARSEYIYLMDFDEISVGINRLHILWLKRSPEFAVFQELWDPANFRQNRDWLQNNISDSRLRENLLESYKIAIGPSGVPQRLKTMQELSKKFPFFSFHNNPEDYQWLRQLALKNRIQAYSGNLLGDLSIQSTAKSLDKISCKLSIFYFSNAEEYFRYPESFRKNLLSLPVSKNSFAIRTVSGGAKQFGFPEGEKFPEIPFHYNIQNLENMKEWMRFTTPLSVFRMVATKKDLGTGISIVDKTPQILKWKELGKY